MRRLKTVRRPPIYPKTPGHLPCSSLTHPLPLPSRRPSVSFGGFGVRSKFMPDPSVSDEGRQEVRLIRHQELYPEPDRGLWFHHTTKEAVAIDALGPNAVMDSWQGPRRSYQVVRSFLGGVELVAVLSAMDGKEALSLLNRLVPIVADSPLARWHDAQQEAYMHLLETL